MGLTKNQINYIARHKEQITKAYKTQIYFSFDSKDTGEMAFDYLMNAYPNEINYSAYSGWFGWGDKRDFYLGFTDASTRDRIFNELTSATDVTNPDTSLVAEVSETTTGNAVVYVIIGVATFIIFLLIWKKTRK